MPFTSKRPKLEMVEEEVRMLEQLAQSRSEAVGRVERAKILLRYNQGATVSSIASELRTNRPRVERCLSKALELGVRAALEDLPGRGRHPSLSAEGRAVGGCLGVPEAEGFGLCARTLDHPSAGRACAQALRSCRSSEPEGAGAGNRVEDFARQSSPASQDPLLLGTARSGV